MEEWDLIGVADVPEAADEYDSYLERLGPMLRDGSSESEVSRYLSRVRTDDIGLLADRPADERASRAILGWWATQPRAHGVVFPSSDSTGDRLERVAWEPGWYWGDQSIGVGLAGEFSFCAASPDELGYRGPERFFFSNGVPSAEQIIVGSGRITAIWHPALEAIREVDTGGDTYVVCLADGTYLDVEEEQNPGWVGDAWAFDEAGAAIPRRPPGVRNWRMVVVFESLSDLRPADAQRSD